MGWVERRAAAQLPDGICHDEICFGIGTRDSRRKLAAPSYRGHQSKGKPARDIRGRFEEGSEGKAMSDRPKPEQDEKGRFIAGNSGNGGRPRGARAKLGEAFMEAMRSSF